MASCSFAKDVVHDCSFAIERGKLTVMIGPSGCGKSTLIRLLAGFEQPDRARSTIDGKPVTGPGARPAGAFPGDRAVSVDDDIRTISCSARAPAASDAAKRSNTAEFLLQQGRPAAISRSKYPTQLSGGMQRRAELARAMINKPKVMILDEPFRGLDAMTKAADAGILTPSSTRRTGARTFSSPPTSTRRYSWPTGFWS